MREEAGRPHPDATGHVDPRLLVKLRCPACESPVSLEGDGRLRCVPGGHEFAHRNGLPILLDSRAAAGESDGGKGEAYAQVEESSFRARLRRLARDPAILKIRQAFGKLDAMIAPLSPISIQAWMDRIRPHLPPSPIEILDLGGGSGGLRSLFCGPADDYVILEVDPEVRFVQENAGKHAYLIGDAHSTVFGADQFDLILMIEVLEHMRDPFRIFENCTKWLKPGGILLVKVPQYWHIHGWPSDYFRYTVYGLKELSRRARLEVVDAWPLGGPCVLLHAMFFLNFGGFLHGPILRQLFAYPTIAAAMLCDRLFFPDYTKQQNPDTRGWIMVARKPAR